MSKQWFCSVVVLVGLSGVSLVQADSKPFSVKAFLDQHVGNDAQVGPDRNEQQIGVHIRDIDTRRRVGLFSFDISALKGEGIVFTNVSLSNLGASAGPINVYGVIEALDNLVPETELTWNKAPGVKNDPPPASNTAVVLDLADLTPLLMTFTSPANFVRSSTAASQSLADFINSDDDGIITLLFAPNVGSSAILRAKENNEGPVGGSPMEGGTFLLGLYGVPDYLPSNPCPADREIEVYRDIVLDWDPGIYAQTHDVYLGTDVNQVKQASRADPRDVLVSQDQTADTYVPGRLEFSRTYYWRVDEVNAPPASTVYRGPVWSFRVEDFASTIEKIAVTASVPSEVDMGPENTVNGSGLDAEDRHSMDAKAMWLSGLGTVPPLWIQYDFDKMVKLHEMWIWNYNGEFESIIGFGIQDVTVQYSMDGATWTVLGDYKLNPGPEAEGYAPNTTIPFAGAVARHVRLMIQSNWGGLDQFGLSEVRFLQIPTHARVPVPASGQTDVELDSALTWCPGREAAQHKVYFGADQKAVAEGAALLETVSQRRIQPPALDLGTTYFWRVEEVNEASIPGVWAGDVWSFTTTPFRTVEDFEAYDDECNKVYYAWKGGTANGANAACNIPAFAGNGTGSVVGNANPPYAERTIVHGGNQSMPVSYTNTVGVLTSVAERTWTSPQDWTTKGADAVRIFVRGLAANVADRLTMTIEDASGVAKTVNHPSLQVVQQITWQEWVVPFSEFAAAGVNMKSVKKLMIGVGDPGNPLNGAGQLYIDDVEVGRQALSQ